RMYLRVGEDRGGGRPVADSVKDAPGQVTDEHATHIFERIRKLDGPAGDDRGVVQDLWWLAAEDRADGDGPRERAERRAEQVGHAVDAAQECRARRPAVQNTSP